MTTTTMMMKVHLSDHLETCELFPDVDCEGCDYELHYAIDNFAEGKWLSFSWIGSTGEGGRGWKHDPCYDNIGWWRVTEQDYLELGRRVGMELDFQEDNPIHSFRVLNQDGAPSHPDDYMWTGGLSW